jgi:hypothetical protein
MKYNRFKELGIASDKVFHHGYHRIYPWFLNHFCQDIDICILEIGIDQSNSIPLWKHYFNNPEIHGIDIDEKNTSLENVYLYKVDQSSALELDIFSKTKFDKFQIIIDDGSHVPEHQILTLKKLWKTLKNGGVYIIEDIETSYWGKSSNYGYKFNSNSLSVINELKKSIDYVNSEFCITDSSSIDNDLSQIFKEIEIISFSHNSIILIKKNILFNEFYGRVYRSQKDINKNDLKRRLFRYLHRKLFYLFT